MHRLAIALFLPLAACAGARKGAPSPIVRDLHFKGNGGFIESYFEGDTDYALRTQLETQGTPWGLLTPGASALVEARPLDREALARDSTRLEVWYAHHGWFDARVLGWHWVEIRRERASFQERWARLVAPARLEDDDAHAAKLAALRRAAVVDLTVDLEPGPRALVREIRHEGASPALKTVIAAVMRNAELQVGDPFFLEYADYTRDRLLTALRDHAFAHAEVAVSFEAYPKDRAVDVCFTYRTGPPSRVGAVIVTGLSNVPEVAVRDALRFEEGDSYKVTDLREAQARLFALGVFSLVEVAPDLSDASAKEVPVEVRLGEAAPIAWRAGGGLTYTGTHLNPRLRSTLEHRNLGDRLVRGELGLTAGLSSRLDSLQAPSSWFPIYGANAAFRWPRFPHPRIELSATAAFAQDLQSGQLAYQRPSGTLGLTWRPDHQISLRGGLSLERFSYLELTGSSLSAARLTFGEDFQNPYQLSTFDLAFTLDTRDDPLFSRTGTLLETRARQALPVVGSYRYTDLAGDLRHLHRFRFGTDRNSGALTRALHRALNFRVLALRAHARALVPWGDSALPYPELAFLGGDRLRGFKPDQVGTYDCLCTYESTDGDGFTGVPGAGQEVTHHFLPHGGTASVGGSLELRHPILVEGASLVLPFVDVGLLAPTWGDLSPSLLRWGAGVGFRYNTPIGPMRLDLAARPLFPEDGLPSGVTGCQAGASLGRPVDWLSTEANRAAPSSRPSFALIGYLGIGEAF